MMNGHEAVRPTRRFGGLYAGSFEMEINKLNPNNHSHVNSTLLIS